MCRSGGRPFVVRVEQGSSPVEIVRAARFKSKRKHFNAVMNAITEHPHVVSRAEWRIARLEHLRREKELTRLHDQLTAERRKLPWVKVEKQYTFDTPAGPKTLADLFEGRSQLIVHHLMFDPGNEGPCPGCSFLADHVDGPRMHFEHHDVKFVAVSRASLPKIAAFKKRMGWRFMWVSSFGSDFNYDYHATTDEAVAPVEYNYRDKAALEQAGQNYHAKGEQPGMSVFCQDETGAIFHTYSCYARGSDILAGAHNFLDLTPKGRNEKGPDGKRIDWVRYHDRYDAGGED
jgi:predicted dithiol-disulfide oxidoreductase (DUF899 family)